MSDIYVDGTYIQNNPSLHEEDSLYKFAYIRELLQGMTFPGKRIRILDVGGGAGAISADVCRLLSQAQIEVECHAFDLSQEMLSVQKGNNPFITLATSDFEEIKNSGNYDLALLIDVIEHIPDNEKFADEIDRLARFIIYNIPTERNLLDWLRNLYMRGQYYVSQTKSLGHIHFFSAGSAKRFVMKHHKFRKSIFPDFSNHVLQSPHVDCVRQRLNALRRAELTISRLIYKWLKWLAPWIIQGSLFVLAEQRKGRA